MSWQRLSLALIPIAGVGLVLGLSLFSVKHLQAEGLTLAWVPALRAGLLVVGGLFSLWLGLRLICARFVARNGLALAVFALPVALMSVVWAEKIFLRIKNRFAAANRVDGDGFESG